MKTFAAYDINPKTLFDELKSAGHPILEIRYRGPVRDKVALACVCVGDSANSSAVQKILDKKSGPKPDFDGVDKHIAALASGVGQSMQVLSSI